MTDWIKEAAAAAPAPDGGDRIQGMPLAAALRAERCAIWGEQAVDGADEAAFFAEHEPSALCLSGGGIRSAAFALGVLQGLARHGLLTRFHYLSTVSGGGYIGAWLTRWIRVAGGDTAKVQQELRKSQPEPAEIRRLRERSNYLTPRIGIASTDSWTAVAIMVRNLLLNWLLLLPALLLVTLAFGAYRDLFLALPGVIPAGWAPAVLALVSAPLAYAVMEATRALPTHAMSRAAAAGRGYATPAAIRRRIVAPTIAWALLLPLTLALAVGDGLAAVFPLGSAVAGYPAFFTFAAAMLGFGLGWFRAGSGDRTHYAHNVHVWTFACAAAALAVGLGCALAVRLLPDLPRPPSGPNPEWHPWLRLGLVLALGPLWAALSHLVVSTIYAGFRRIPRSGPGAAAPASELDREWLARLSAAKLQVPILWAVGGLACLVLPVLLFEMLEGTLAWLAGATASVSGAFAVLGGSSALSAFAPDAAPGRRRSWLSVDKLLVAAAAIFGAALLATAAWVGGQVVGVLSIGPALARDIALAVALAALACLVSWCLSINRFSLHGLYRNRLVRAFLGAVRSGASARQADPFTDFDGADNIRMHDLWVRAPANATVPRALFPIVNLALNATGGDRLAWQERKAVSFTVTPLACGWTDPLSDAAIDEKGSYVPTDKYGGNEADLGMAGSGISLGTAMTISGAAASPNMGYHSSPSVAFLLTLFNLRLGAWLPNPACPMPRSEMGRSGPRHALRPLIKELLGWTDERERHVYLSDGGHFDNLGLYEMVRRRCRFVLVSDAGCDPQCRFEDLGMAARKIFVDQGIRIEIGDIRIVPRGPDTKQAVAFAVGQIVYPDGPAGCLLYLKPSLLPAVVPIGVRAYAALHQDFPHESTGDQWFSESQFESYRSLGESLIQGLGGSGATPPTMAQFFAHVRASIADAPGAAPPAPESGD